MSSDEPPSAAAQIATKSGSPVSDIDNMKVPELKKRLKSMGLSTTGNKADLIERLQEAYLGEKDGSLDGGLDDESLEEALLNDDPDQSALPETLLGTEEYSFSSPEKETQKLAQISVSKPLKKRVIAHVEEPLASTPKVPKPIVIKRDNYPIIEAPMLVSKKDHPLIEPPKSDATEKAIKVSTAADRLELRAKRFNITDPKPKAELNKVDLDKATKVTGVTPIQAPTSANSGNLEVLRKRAERFGENVSTVMKQLENQEKLLKRKQKFVDSGIKSNNLNDKSSSNEQDKKKKRMERFGLVK